jgi:predicted GNAT family acetyltransferase
MKPSLTYREATPEDCALLAEMNAQLIRDEGHRNAMTVPELTERMRGWIASGEYRAVLFLREDTVVAYALYRTEPDGSLFLRHLFVAREWRRQGVGTEAVSLLFREIFPPGLRVTLEVLAQNAAARAFWEAAGFVSYSVCLERFNP